MHRLFGSHDQSVALAVAPTIRVLPEVVNAVNGQIDVLLDGGIRRGGDVVKALCLGAKGVLIGRAYAYGLAAAGGPGSITKADLERLIAAAKETAPAQTIRVEQGPIKIVTDQEPYKM